ncbi:MAG: ubiquitin [Clostridiales bacterium]|nr:ubiquitin [Clostridiales bacterium]
MEHFEMVEKLRQKANISYEEAKNALEHSDWDLLDALVYLESQNKINKEPADSYTTRKEKQQAPSEEEDLRGVFTKVFSYIAELITKANGIHMDVSKKGRVAISIPLTVLILLLIFMFWWVLPILVLGLFLGFRYSFRGHQVTDTVNKAMDKVAQTAEQIKSNMHTDSHQSGK